MKSQLYTVIETLHQFTMKLQRYLDECPADVDIDCENIITCTVEQLQACDSHISACLAQSTDDTKQIDTCSSPSKGLDIC